MKKSRRVLFLGLGTEILLLLIWLWLMNGISSGDMRTSVSPADAVATISSVLGGAMGVLAGVFGVAYLVLRKRENGEP